MQSDRDVIAHLVCRALAKRVEGGERIFPFGHGTLNLFGTVTADEAFESHVRPFGNTRFVPMTIAILFAAGRTIEPKEDDDGA